MKQLNKTRKRTETKRKEKKNYKNKTGRRKSQNKTMWIKDDLTKKIIRVCHITILLFSWRYKIYKLYSFIILKNNKKY